MGKVTYAIGFGYGSPYAKAIKRIKKLARDSLEDGKHLMAADYYFEVAGLLKEQTEKYEPDSLTEEDFKNQRFEGLQNAVKYCKRALNIYEEHESMKQKIRTLGLMVECLVGLEEYDAAISNSENLIQLLQLTKDRTAMRDAFNTIGNIYFRRGHDMDVARCNDFEYARKYYRQERQLLDEFPESTRDLERLKQSSDFNLGVIESKFPDSAATGENRLISAIKCAVSLRMPEAERAAWMELANVRKKYADFSRALQCLQKELSICRANKYEDDERGCLIEIGKTYVELEDFDNALATFDELKKFTKDQDDQDIKFYKKLAVNIRSKKRRIAALSPENDLSTVNARTRLYHDLCREQLKADMFQSALASVEQALLTIDGADTNIQILMSTLRVKLLQLKADILFNIRQSSMETLVSLNDEIIADSRLYFENAKILLEQELEAYERGRKIYTYFDRPDEASHYKQLMDQIKKRYKELCKIDGNDPMEVDSVQESGDEGTIHTDDHSVGDVSDPLPEKPVLRIIHVTLKIDRHRDQVVSVPIRDESCLVEWFMVQTSRRAWEQLGIHPVIDSIIVNGSALSKYETLVEVVPVDLNRVDATVVGFEQHSMLEYYKKACLRYDIEQSAKLLDAIKSSSDDELYLGSTCLGAKDSPALHHMLKYSPPLKHLDLSANLLYNQDVKTLFALEELPRHLDLSCNRITEEIISFFADHAKASGLLSLNLSYNPLQITESNQIYQLLHACPNLEILDLSACDLELDRESLDTLSNYKTTRILIED